MGRKAGRTAAGVGKLRVGLMTLSMKSRLAFNSVMRDMEGTSHTSKA